MIREWFCPGLLDTGPIAERLAAVRDGMVNLYVVEAPDGLVCVDAGWRASAVARGFARLGLAESDVVAVFLTHMHWDHARGCRAFPQAKVFVGADEPAGRFGKMAALSPSWTRVRGGQELTAAGLSVRVIDAPGHTVGSVCYAIGDRLLFTGDALRLRRGEALPYLACLSHDVEQMERSIAELARIEEVELLLTAHNGACHDPADAFAKWAELALGSREAGSATAGDDGDGG